MSPRVTILACAALAALASACAPTTSHHEPAMTPPPAPEPSAAASSAGSDADSAPAPTAAPAPGGSTREIATFGAGCYWCVEAVLEQLGGVLDVTSGFMGGHVESPSYEAVCSGTTGHAEVVQVTFDPREISYDELLSWFWRLHDPTTLNRQGADVGTQYRSAIFYHSEEQRKAALASKAAAQSDFADPIVTEITPASAFYEAKGQHQDYYRSNRQAGYCRAVIAPKLKKLGLEQ